MLYHDIKANRRISRLVCPYNSVKCMDIKGRHGQWASGVVVALMVIVCVGFFLRSYHFGDWLHFELDQSRDARVIDDAFRGSVADLPLLGPKAGGTFLRLGPFFYYFQYLSGLVFGAHPVGYAMGVMLLSVATIGVFFLFVRRLFSDRIALGLAGILATSLFFVMYGRFAWNPNPLPFFVLLGLYALLRSVDLHEEHRGYWWLLCVAAFGIASQLHFLAFLALPIILGIFLLLRRPRYSWKAWVGTVLLVGALYFPVLLNEIETGGRNSQEFIQAVTKKSTKESRSLPEKFLRDVSEHGLASLVIVTGFEGGAFPAFRIEDGTLVRRCVNRCDAGKWYGSAALVVLAVAISAFFWLWWRERERAKADFLLLTGIWFGVTFLLFLPLSYGIAPRFFLLSGPVFLIFLGALLTLMERLFHRHSVGKMLSLSLLGLCIGSNLFFVAGRFSELARAGSEAVDSAPDRVLKERIRVTLEQQNKIIDFLASRSKETGYPVYMFSEPQHRRALKYLLERRGVENAVLGFDGVYRQGVYYIILRAHSDHEDALRKYRASYMVGKKTSFGTLVAFELFPKPEAIGGERQDFSLKKPSDSTAPPRYTWREWLDRNQTIQTDSEADDTVDASIDDTTDEGGN